MARMIIEEIHVIPTKIGSFYPNVDTLPAARRLSVAVITRFSRARSVGEEHDGSEDVMAEAVRVADAHAAHIDGAGVVLALRMRAAACQKKCACTYTVRAWDLHWTYSRDSRVRLVTRCDIKMADGHVGPYGWLAAPWHTLILMCLALPVDEIVPSCADAATSRFAENAS